MYLLKQRTLFQKSPLSCFFVIVMKNNPATFRFPTLKTHRAKFDGGMLAFCLEPGRASFFASFSNTIFSPRGFLLCPRSFFLVVHQSVVRASPTIELFLYGL